MSVPTQKLFYKIGEVCEICDVQPHVLRYWETEFAMLSPSKNHSGQRIYRHKDVELIRRIKRLLYQEGYTIAGANKKLMTDFRNGDNTEKDFERQQMDMVFAIEHGEQQPAAAAAPHAAPVAAPSLPAALEPLEPADGATAARDLSTDQLLQDLRGQLEEALRLLR